MTVGQKRPSYPLSPTATEKGSNLVIGESFCAESLSRKNASVEGGYHYANNLGLSKVLKTGPGLHNMNRSGGEKDGLSHHLVSQGGPGYPSGGYFQGENELVHLRQSYLHEEGIGFKLTLRHLSYNLVSLEP